MATKKRRTTKKTTTKAASPIEESKEETPAVEEPKTEEPKVEEPKKEKPTPVVVAEKPEPAPEPESKKEEPVVDKATAKAVKLSRRTADAVERTVASYLGTDATKKVIDKIVDAIEVGHQVCIVAGDKKINEKYTYREFKQPFYLDDSSKDIPARVGEGVVLNVTRFIATKNLYPRD